MICSDLSWKSHIQLINSTHENVVCIGLAEKLLLSTKINIFLNKSAIRSLIEHCYHLCRSPDIASPTSWTSTEACWKVHKLFEQSLANDLLPFRVWRDVTSLGLFYRFWFGRCGATLNVKIFFSRGTFSRRANPLIFMLPLNAVALRGR